MSMTRPGSHCLLCLTASLARHVRPCLSLEGPLFGALFVANTLPISGAYLLQRHHLSLVGKLQSVAPLFQHPLNQRSLLLHHVTPHFMHHLQRDGVCRARSWLWAPTLYFTALKALT